MGMSQFAIPCLLQNNICFYTHVCVHVPRKGNDRQAHYYAEISVSIATGLLLAAIQVVAHEMMPTSSFGG
jgi:hypothetical protein